MWQLSRNSTVSGYGVYSEKKFTLNGGLNPQMPQHTAVQLGTGLTNLDHSSSHGMAYMRSRIGTMNTTRYRFHHWSMDCSHTSGDSLNRFYSYSAQTQGQHWQPIRDPFELTSPAQHALRRVISFWNFPSIKSPIITVAHARAAELVVC